MSFDGAFADSLIPEQLNKISVSFLVNDLQIRRGGVAANIAFGMGVLGLRPLLVGAVGEDFAPYQSWLERHGVDCSGVLVSDMHHTARFVCTTDRDQAQIASFYAGAMAQARDIELGPLHARQALDLVLIGPNDPDAMRRHTQECRERGIPFIADPSQQLAWSDGEMIRDLIDGATYLITNDYEAAMIAGKTGWSPADIAGRVAMWVTTHGKDGVSIRSQGAGAAGDAGASRDTGSDDDGGARSDAGASCTIHVGVVPTDQIADPTGVGDGFRAGFFAGQAWGLSAHRSAQLGSLIATYVLETVGTQEYSFTPADARQRLTAAYDSAAADEIGAHLAGMPG